MRGVDPKGSLPKVSPNILTGPGGGDRSPRSLPQSITLQLLHCNYVGRTLFRFGLRLHEIEPPTLQGDRYSIAVYGVPEGGFKGSPENWASP